MDFPQSNIGWVSLRFTQSIFKHRYNIPVINTILKNRPFYTNVTYKSDATTLQLPGRSMFSSEPKSVHTSPSSGLFILVLEDFSSLWGQTRVAWGRDQHFQFISCWWQTPLLSKLGCWQPHLTFLPQRLSPHQGKDPCHEGQSRAIGSIMLVSGKPIRGRLVAQGLEWPPPFGFWV